MMDAAPFAAPSNQSEKLVPLAMLAVAAFMFACGLCSTLFYFVAPLMESNAAARVETNTIFGALAGTGFFFGAVLGWQGLRTWRGREPFPAASLFPPTLAFVLVFIGAILLGLGANWLQGFAVYAFPPWHFIAAMTIPLGLLAYSARRLGKQSSASSLIGAFTWGALGATSLALVIEVVTAALLLLVAFVVVSAMAEGRALLEQLTMQVRAAVLSEDARMIGRLASNPLLISVAFVYFAVIVPPIEEAFKTLGLAFFDRQRVHSAEWVLWGMGAGAGFAALENVFNGAGAAAAWSIVMLMRFGATIMHIATGGILARGWYAARVEGRWRGLVIAYLASVLYHALWNGIVIILAQGALALASDPGAAVERLLAQGVLMFAWLGALAVLALFGTAWIGYSTRSAQMSLQAST